MSVDIDDPNLPLVEIFRLWPRVAQVFRQHGATCVGCPIAPFHTVSDVCAAYCLDEAGFRNALRTALAEASAPRRSAPPAGVVPSQ